MIVSRFNAISLTFNTQYLHSRHVTNRIEDALLADGGNDNLHHHDIN